MTDPSTTSDPDQNPDDGFSPVPPTTPTTPDPYAGASYDVGPLGQPQAVPPIPPAAPYAVGYPGYASPHGPPPPNGQTSAIVATVISGAMTFFCAGVGLFALIFGIIGIVKASTANNLWMMGQTAASLQAAQESSKWARVAWIVLGVSVVLAIAAFALILFWAESGTSVPSTGTYGT